MQLLNLQRLVYGLQSVGGRGGQPNFCPKNVNICPNF